ncbi:MAG: hypothetical protein COA70_12880 [Planctomycetota bacterium]|nr:MAG: hypothetical protein COA70_12880 [Planctomycetota bacterium]
MTWGKDSETDSEGRLWQFLLILTALIALVSSFAFWIAGKRAYAQWMETADDLARLSATKAWGRVQSLAVLFFLLGGALGAGIGFVWTM